MPDRDIVLAFHAPSMRQYQDIFRTPDYFWFDPVSLEFREVHLMAGQYQPLVANDRGWLWSQQLQVFLGIRDRQLRFFTTAGELVATPAESAQVAEVRAAVAEERAAVAEALLDRYRQQFGELPDA